jgi:hypothetical protein
MIPVVVVLCYHQLLGFSEVDVLVVFFHHVFNGLGSLSYLDLTTPMANTMYIWHH